MANAELHNLADSYAHGNLSLEDYRMQRAEILDAFSANLINNPDSPITLRLKKPAGVIVVREFLTHKVMIAAGIVFFILIIIITFLFSDNSDTSPALSETQSIISQETSNSTETQANNQPLHNNPQENISVPESSIHPSPSPTSKEPLTTRTYENVANLMEQFVQDGYWNIKRVHALQHQWEMLSQGEINRAHNSPWFNQFKFVLIQNIAKQRAKASLGDAQATKQAELLTLLANQLGLENVN